ncbi:MAG: hypothetical protein JWN46_3961 [Acidimicrobiales bacterium]|nr:hypothetical protein [Acidimicrobiales bacterium]
MAEHERPDLADGQVAGAPSDNTTLLVILRQLGDAGWTADFHATDDGGLRCPRCGTVFPAATFRVDAVRRLEGASDPADEQIVLAVTCPDCGVRGTVVLGYGPNASDADTAVLAQIVL